jgi:hypothetical protein
MNKETKEINPLKHSELPTIEKVKLFGDGIRDMLENETWPNPNTWAVAFSVSGVPARLSENGEIQTLAAPIPPAYTKPQARRLARKMRHFKGVGGETATAMPIKTYWELRLKNAEATAKMVDEYGVK